jgi:hypothetical protein
MQSGTAGLEVRALKPTPRRPEGLLRSSRARHRHRQAGSGLRAGGPRWPAHRGWSGRGRDGRPSRPVRPTLAAPIAIGIEQVHSAEYRNPSQLVDGPVLVVGAGNSDRPSDAVACPLDRRAPHRADDGGGDRCGRAQRAAHRARGRRSVGAVRRPCPGCRRHRLGHRLRPRLLLDPLTDPRRARLAGPARRCGHG